MANPEKIQWQGEGLSIQPRIRLLRSFDQRSHQYLGYSLCLNGTIGKEARRFWIGIGKGAHAKHQFQLGSVASGECLPVMDERLETVEFYKVSKIKVLETPNIADPSTPP